MTRATGGRVRLVIATMPAADRLRMFVGFQITDVTARRDGVVVDLKLPGRLYNPPRRLVLKDVTRIGELIDGPPPEPEWEQLQIDIGDEIYERERYSETDNDIEPGRTATKGEQPT